MNKLCKIFGHSLLFDWKNPTYDRPCKKCDHIEKGWTIPPIPKVKPPKKDLQ